MRITFTLTAKDILERQSAIDKAVGYKPWRSLAITSLLLLVLVGFIVITWILDKNSGNNFSLGACTMLAVAISMAALRMAKRKQMLRKGFSENQHLQGPRTADLDEEGCQMRSSTGITTRCEWKAYLGLLETESLLLLFLSRRDGQILPKRAFASEADLKAARSLIEDNIGLLNPAPFPAGPPAP